MSQQQEQPKIGTIAWVDLTVDDAPQVRDFYKAVVGWDSTDVQMDKYNDYAMILPGTEQAVAGVCHKAGMNSDLPSRWLIYVIVKDIDQSIRACRANGGKVLVAARDLGQHGRFAVIEDPAGAAMALWMTK